jgi:flagellin-like protein
MLTRVGVRGERAVSPVVATLLMMAIVTVLGGIVAGAVFGLGGVDSAQNALGQFEGLLDSYTP